MVRYTSTSSGKGRRSEETSVWATSLEISIFSQIMFLNSLSKRLEQPVDLFLLQANIIDFFVRILGNVQTTKIFAIPKQKILKILKNYPDIFSKMVANSRKNIKSLREILVT